MTIDLNKSQPMAPEEQKLFEIMAGEMFEYEWKMYRHHCYPNGLSQSVEQHVRQAFIAGALASAVNQRAITAQVPAPNITNILLDYEGSIRTAAMEHKRKTEAADGRP